MTNKPNFYLRFEVTKSCNLTCSYCHAEGCHARCGEMPLEIFAHSMAAAGLLGCTKIKLTGGEPLLRRDIPQLIACARALNPQADLSIITSGAVSAKLIGGLYDAGLSRINLSLHGYSKEAFRQNGGNAHLYRLRQQFIEKLLMDGHPHKFNYVYTSDKQYADLSSMIDDLRGSGVVISVLDDLFNPVTSVNNIIPVVTSLLGTPDVVEKKSKVGLPTLLYRYYSAGLNFEFKHQRLGDYAPLRECATCSQRQDCKEGIFSLRVGIDGRLSPCLYREELRHTFSRETLANREALGQAWCEYLQGVLV